MRGINQKYVVKEMIYDGKSNLDSNNWYTQGHGKPDILTTQVVNLLDAQGKSYPISAMSLFEEFGIEDSSKKQMKDVEYTYPVIERTYKSGRVSTSITTGTPGLGGAEFIVEFDYNWMPRYAMIQSPRGVMARIMDDPKKVLDRWAYKLKLNATSASEFCPLTELASGQNWAVVGNNVPLVDARSTSHKMSTWGKVKNQVGFVRKDLAFGDVSAQRVMEVEITAEIEGKVVKTKNWMDYFMYTFESDWYEELELQYWYSKYNRTSTGLVMLKEGFSGEDIPTFAGIFDQIPNQTSFSKLTYKQLQNNITDALDGIRDADNMNIYFYTGKGGIRDIDEALQTYANQKLTTLGGDVGDKFITGTGRDLGMTGYFTHFAHIDGYNVYVKYCPVFHHGRIAQAQKASGYVHPETGFPLESHRLVALDVEPVNGMANFQFPSHVGFDEPYNENIVLGLHGSKDIPPSLARLMGGSSNKQASTDVTRSSYHRWMSRGLQIMRANRCLDMRCIF